MSDVSERMAVEDGKLHITRAQDVAQLISENRELSSDAPKAFGDAKMRLVGRIPLVIAEQWSRECGAALGSPEFREYVKKKLMSNEFAGFRVKGV